MADTAIPVKCTLVGANNTGKTTLAIRYTTGLFCPMDQLPRVADNYCTHVTVNNQVYTLSIWDTHRRDDYDRLGPLSYPGTDVFIICFSVLDKASLETAVEYWAPHMNHFVADVPWILVGTRIDAREECAAKALVEWRQPVTVKEGEKTAKKYEAWKYIECSALEEVNVREVFEEAIIASQIPKKARKKKRSCVLL